MQHLDSLHLLNLETVRRIEQMSADELWAAVLERFDDIKQMAESTHSERKSFCSGWFFAAPHGVDHLKKHFWREWEEASENVVFGLVMDWAFEGDKIWLDWYATGGFYDHPLSCDTEDGDDIMPMIDEYSEMCYYKEDFRLLEPAHLDIIISAMEKHEAELTKNTRKDINKIIALKQLCEQNPNYKVAYIYF